eukprot:1187829-Prorocentrum_minimum.AAC.1
MKSYYKLVRALIIYYILRGLWVVECTLAVIGTGGPGPYVEANLAADGVRELEVGKLFLQSGHERGAHLRRLHHARTRQKGSTRTVSPREGPVGTAS